MSTGKKEYNIKYMNIKSVVHNIMIYCTKSLIVYVQV